MTQQHTALKKLAMGAMSALFFAPAFAGSGDAAMEASLHQYHAVTASAEWHNVWMPQTSANAVAMTRSGDEYVREIIAGYSRASLDRGGWENTLMTNSNYAAANPLLAVDIGSGATTSAAAAPIETSQQLAMR